ncbi:MAG: APC family permease [Fuerstiella sp.]|nr:APC family permease [Fuerstiella sp.]
MPESPSKPHSVKEHDGQLGELASTAICGNDITSSCLYVSALAIVYAGKLAPISLLMVAAVLFLFRRIYAEVVGALPLNGGAYNALLNTTSKRAASVAACLTVLSYMATAVISALEGMHYVQHLWSGLNVSYATVALLGFFMVLTIVGITESAAVAIGIFVTHMITLTLLVVVGVIFVFVSVGQHEAPGLAIAEQNFKEDLPPAPGTNNEFADLRSDKDSEGSSSVWLALFFGFSVSMLGISGFESSSNFVEEQQTGVFPKTLRNMWYAVSVFNPLMALLALSVLSMVEVDRHQTALLAHMGQVVGSVIGGDGKWLSTLVSIDAAMVLSGAVLTSFVGVTGLVHRMTLDRCLPQFLLKTNRRGTTHRIIIAFFLLCVSVLVITHQTVPRGTAEAISSAVGNLKVPTDASPELVRHRVNREVLSLDRQDLSDSGKDIFKTLSKEDRANLLNLSTEDVKQKLQSAGESGQIKKLAGIYTISFLSVMALFGLGNILLKLRRANLPRPDQASWIAVIFAISAVVAGLVGNALIDSAYVWTFLQYFIPTMLVITVMLGRIALLKMSLSMVKTLTASVVGPMTRLTKAVREKIDEINAQQIVFFTRGDNIANLNSAMLYVRQNEHTNRLKIVTVNNEDVQTPENLEQELEFLDQAYPEIDIDFVQLEGQFGPELIQELSDKWSIPKNLMFIGSPGGRLPYDLGELGGVRLII